jgi:2-polyprenyl-3-methyl-5-hydroxy-6-metoxy-1,4-benzoquinol methylase
MRALIIVSLVAGVAHADENFPSNVPAAWFACEKDADCGAVESVCGPEIAVRAARVADAKKLDDRTCLGIKKPPPAAECRAGRCAVKETLGLGGGHAHGPLGHRFDRSPEDYAKHFDDPKRDRWQKPREVVKLLAVTPGMVVADLGAGTGYFLPHLARAAGGGEVHALDVEPQLVSYMEARAKKEGLANVKARKVAYDDPQLAPASVDRVLIVDTWHHIDGRDAYVKKLAAGLKPGGRVAIVEVTKASPHGPPAALRLAPAQVIRELEAGGLVNVKVVKESLPRQYVVVGEKPGP